MYVWCVLRARVHIYVYVISHISYVFCIYYITYLLREIVLGSSRGWDQRWTSQGALAQACCMNSLVQEIICACMCECISVDRDKLLTMEQPVCQASYFARISLAYGTHLEAVHGGDRGLKALPMSYLCVKNGSHLIVREIVWWPQKYSNPWANLNMSNFAQSVVGPTKFGRVSNLDLLQLLRLGSRGLQVGSIGQIVPCMGSARPFL